MGTVLNLASVEQTRLWQRLVSGFANDSQRSIAQDLAGKVLSACRSAVERIKQFPYYHPEFTLHDERHLVRVTELMAMILNDDLESLNPIEISLLILSAFYHDQGMVPDSSDWILTEDSSEFKVSFERWEQDHPNVRDIRQQLENPRLNNRDQDELTRKLSQHRDAHRSSFLRMTHGIRAEQLVNSLFGSTESLSIVGVNLAPLLGRLCASHVLPVSRLTDENGFRVDHAIGTVSVNLRFLALVLRIADILDFDRDRTPESLLRAINISSPVSLTEWAKHRSVEGWEISDRRIRFTLACEHPAYQKAAYEFMDAIDHELRESHRMVDDFPRGTPDYYRLRIPRQVERDRIEPKNNSYRYADLEFGLSRDEIVKLLMTDKLYNGNSLFVRELIQNSLDALRHRVATYGLGNPDWKGGLISLTHFVDSDGHQVVRCVDNGIGMDEAIVRNFLTNVGRSYYRSPEFEQQRTAFRENGVDFDPCAQFGIGFMSCFMFGDRIAIKTRRDYGPGHGYGEPLEIEISGLSSIVVIREGKSDQPIGTTVEITGPRKPAFLDEWADEVNLCGIVNGYALATEFPIVAQTLIEEIAQEVRTPVRPAFRRTPVEEIGAKQIKVIEYDLKDSDPRLNGTIRIGLLIDENGEPCIKNSEAGWELVDSKSENKLHLTIGAEKHRYYGLGTESTVCIDGILICGRPGRQDDSNKAVRKLGTLGNPLSLGDPFMVDIRGDLKPTITPARTPPESLLRREDPTWNRVNELLSCSHAKAWISVLDATRRGLSHEDFWRLTLLHRIHVYQIPAEVLWDILYVPTVSPVSEEDIEWVPISELGEIEPDTFEENSKPNWGFRTTNGRKIRFSTSIGSWYPGGFSDANYKLVQLLLRFAKIRLIKDTFSISICQTEEDKSLSCELGMSDGPFSYLFMLEYSENARDFLSLQGVFDSVNRSHPLVEFVQKHRTLRYSNLTDLQIYCSSVVWLLSDNECLKRLSEGKLDDGRQYRRLGILYNAIEWSKHDPSLAPPYRVWTSGRGKIEITREDLVRWSTFSAK